MSGGNQTFVCTDGARRLDKWLATQRGIDSRKRAQDAILTGKVEVDGEVVPPEALGLPVPPGTTFVVVWNKPGTKEVAKGQVVRRNLGMPVLLDDRDVVVVDKPPGIPCDGKRPAVPDSIKQRLDSWLRPKGQRAHLVHRLDHDGSGVLVVPRHEAAFEALRTAFSEQKIQRTTWCLVQGVPEPRQGTWSHAMRWDASARRQRLTRPDHKGAVLAQADYTVVDVLPGGYCTIEVTASSTRRRQVRAHLQAEGLRLVGDPKAAAREGEPEPPRFARPAVHVQRFVFPHPRHGKAVEVTAPLPPDLQSLVDHLNDVSSGSSTPS